MGNPRTKKCRCKGPEAWGCVTYQQNRQSPGGRGNESEVGGEDETRRGRRPESQSALHAWLRSLYPAGNEDL